MGAGGQLDGLLAGLGLADDLEARASSSRPRWRPGGKAAGRRRSARGPAPRLGPERRAAMVVVPVVGGMPPSCLQARSAQGAHTRSWWWLAPRARRPARNSSTALTRRWVSGSSERPSLENIELMCFSTARSLRSRAVATAALFLPWAISVRISCSRGVRSSGRLGRLGAGGDQALDHLGVDHRAAPRRPRGSRAAAGRRRRPAPSAGRPGRSEPPSNSASAYSGSAYWREHDHADARVRLPDLAGGPDALVGAGRRHADVGEHDVGRWSASTAASSASKSPHTSASSSSSTASMRRATPSRTR